MRGSLSGKSYGSDKLRAMIAARSRAVRELSQVDRASYRYLVAQFRAASSMETSSDGYSGANAPDTREAEASEAERAIQSRDARTKSSFRGTTMSLFERVRSLCRAASGSAIGLPAPAMVSIVSTLLREADPPHPRAARRQLARTENPAMFEAARLPSDQLNHPANLEPRVSNDVKNTKSIQPHVPLAPATRGGGGGEGRRYEAAGAAPRARAERIDVLPQTDE